MRKPPFLSHILDGKMGTICADIQQTLYPPYECLGLALGLINNAHTRLQAAVLESRVKRSQLGRGELLGSTQEKGQKG